jgi:hypothetical protein
MVEERQGMVGCVIVVEVEVDNVKEVAVVVEKEALCLSPPTSLPYRIQLLPTPPLRLPFISPPSPLRPAFAHPLSFALFSLEFDPHIMDSVLR